ncbi:MAG: HlyC/CorC family transporter, partial [Candidatus Sulfotelmatobacter sp.]
MNYAVAIALLLLLGLLTLVSYVDRLYQEAGKFLSREFQDNIDFFEQKVEPQLGAKPLRVSRSRAALSMAVLTQLTMAAIALMVGFVVFSDQLWSIYEIL